MQENEREPTATDEDEQQPDVNESSMTHEALGAYVLDALPEDERAEFELHLAGCETCRAELAGLQGVVALLPKLFEQEPDEARLARDGAGIVPDPSIRDEVLAAAPRPVTEEAEPEPVAAASDEPESSPDTVRDQPTIAADEEVAGTEAAAEATVEDSSETEERPSAEAAPIAERPAATEPPPEEEPAASETTEPAAAEAVDNFESIEIDEALPESAMAPVASTEPAPVTVHRRGPSLPIPWILAGILLIVAALSILWGLAMLDRIGDLEDEIALQNQQIVDLRVQRDSVLDQDTALITPLAPTTAGESGATATFYISGGAAPSILRVTGMAQLPEGRTYQIWLLPEEGGPQAGPTFRVNGEGAAFVSMTTQILPSTAVAITDEPEGGSEAPTSDPVMQTL